MVTPSPRSVPIVKLPKQNVQIKQLERAEYDHFTGLLRVGKLQTSIFTPVSTKIKRTGLSLPKYDKHHPAILSPKDPRALGMRPLKEGLKRYSNIKGEGALPIDEIRYAFKQIATELTDILSAAQLPVRVFTKTESINGPPRAEFPYSKPLDRAGSAGFPWNMHPGVTNKNSLLTQCTDGKWRFKQDFEVAERVSKTVDARILAAKHSEAWITPFVAYNKDECVTEKKVYIQMDEEGRPVDKRKTRVFFSGPIDYLISYRMYFLAAMQRLQETRHNHPIKVGIGNTMAEWNTMAFQLSSMGESGFASDVSAFDACVRTEWLEELLVVYETIYANLDPNYKPEDKIIREILHSSVEGAYVINQDNLYKLQQAQVSGCPGTAVENSMVMWALYFCIWRRLAKVNAPLKQSFASFRKYVELAIYGDDNICMVHQDVSWWFNFHSFQREAGNFGFEITSESKSGNHEPSLRPLSDMTFLKRSFVLTEGYYLGPLDPHSITKALVWTHQGTARPVERFPVEDNAVVWPLCSDPVHTKSVIEALLPEIALNGREFYQSTIQELKTQVHNAGIDVRFATFEDAIAELGYNF